MFLENQTKACKSRVIKRSKGFHFHDVNGHKYWPVLIIVNIQLYSVFVLSFNPVKAHIKAYLCSKDVSIKIFFTLEGSFLLLLDSGCWELLLENSFCKLRRWTEFLWRPVEVTPDPAAGTSGTDVKCSNTTSS